MSSIEIYVQARMGSTRLPGKVLKNVLGKPLLVYLLERLKRSAQATYLAILTTEQTEDDAIFKICQEHRIPCFRGSVNDVLSRYYLYALERKPNAIVRVMADCPLLDPAIIDAVITEYQKQEVDYVSNTLQYTYPRGMDVEVFSFKALIQAYEEARKEGEREHVTLYMYRHPEIFKIHNVYGKKDYSQYRLTVDTPEDFELIKNIIEYLYPVKPAFTIEDIMASLKAHPEWVAINAHIKQKIV